MLTPIDPQRPLMWHPLVEVLSKIISDEVYMVGGAVRDAYLHRPLHDLDLATPTDGRPLARYIANHFGGAYYSLDAERGVGRAIISWDGTPLTIDVAQFRGANLLTDLQLRDLTLNAMAVRLAPNPQQILDPLGGISDLAARRIRECSPDALSNDPIRMCRAVRAGAVFGMRIEPTTRQHIKHYAPRLAHVSPERIRDEFFQILDSPHPSASIDILQRLGLLEHIIPASQSLLAVQQGPPHQLDVWGHTLLAVRHLSTILQLFSSHRDENLVGNLQFGLIAWTLDAFRPQLEAFLSHTWANGRSHRALLLLTAFLHDVGKPQTRSVQDDGRVRFLSHQDKGADIAQTQAVALRLSNDEAGRVYDVIRHHMRPHWLHNDKLSSRAIYRFWRDTGPAGVDICLLALADYLATYGTSLDQKQWISYLEMEHKLLESYFVYADTRVNPPPLITGQYLLDHFDLQPGPRIGEILEQLRELQASGEILSYQDALEWVEQILRPQ
ncbi:MAG TPA: HD domain-containing protein [Aggregatilineaceae bacterium]|nr:HD domain-containing protein [Aggregatilineaceae bacterium]